MLPVPRPDPEVVAMLTSGLTALTALEKVLVDPLTSFVGYLLVRYLLSFETCVDMQSENFIGLVGFTGRTNEIR